MNGCLLDYHLVSAVSAYIIAKEVVKWVFAFKHAREEVNILYALVLPLYLPLLRYIS